MTSVPPTQPPAAPETDVRLTEAEREALGNTVRDAIGRSYGFEAICRQVERIVAERVRVVEGERDRLLRERDNIGCSRFTCADDLGRMRARAESAEAAHAALAAVAEDIAYQHAATIDGEFGCCHDEDALRAGGRAPEFDGDEFEPIPDDCPGKRTLDRHLARIAREG